MKVRELLASTYFDYLGIGLLTAFVYLLIDFPFVRLSRWMEKKMARSGATIQNEAPSFWRRRRNHTLMKEGALET